MKISTIALLFLLISFCGKGQSGSFLFTEYKPLQSKPVHVFYHIPKGNPASMPVLMAFHGDERDAEAYRNDWVEAADKYSFIVIAPEFTDAGFPGSTGYNTGNLFRDGDNPSLTQNPDSLWTFALVEPLFQYITQFTGSQAQGFVAFGHSAGAQFLHRFALCKSASRMQLAICANAGWYTIPDSTIRFPYGLQKSPISTNQVKTAFQKNLLVLLGQQDVHPNSAGLRHTPEADAQGLNRLARGRYFYAESKKQAELLSTDFRWSVAEVSGVGHNHTLMAKNAISYVIQAFESQNPTFNQDTDITLTSNGILLAGLQAAEPFTVSVFSIDGQLLQSTKGNFAENQLIAMQAHFTGILIVRLETTRGLKTRKFSSLFYDTPQ